MQRRFNFAYFILASAVAVGLTPLMVDADAQARIAFVSERAGNREIYVMDNDGGNLRICENSLKIARMIGIPHGPQTVNALSLLLLGFGPLQLGTRKST